MDDPSLNSLFYLTCKIPDINYDSIIRNLQDKTSTKEDEKVSYHFFLRRCINGIEICRNRKLINIRQTTPSKYIEFVSHVLFSIERLKSNILSAISHSGKEIKDFFDLDKSISTPTEEIINKKYDWIISNQKKFGISSYYQFIVSHVSETLNINRNFVLKLLNVLLLSITDYVDADYIIGIDRIEFQTETLIPLSKNILDRNIIKKLIFNYSLKPINETPFKSCDFVIQNVYHVIDFLNNSYDKLENIFLMGNLYKIPTMEDNLLNIIPKELFGIISDNFVSISRKKMGDMWLYSDFESNGIHKHFFDAMISCKVEKFLPNTMSYFFIEYYVRRVCITDRMILEHVHNSCLLKM